jgi:flagellar motor protein MotB
MSKLYEDLKIRGRGGKKTEDLDLFAFAAARKAGAATQPPPETAPPASVPPVVEPSKVNADETERLPVRELPPEPVPPPVVSGPTRPPYPVGQSPLLGLGRGMARHRRILPVVLAVAGSVVGILALWAGIAGILRHARNAQAKAVAVVEPRAKTEPKTQRPGPPALKSAAKALVKPAEPHVTASKLPFAEKPLPVDLKVAGVSTRVENGEVTLYFDNGLFADALVLSAEGKAVLKRLADRMRPHAAGLSIKVIGCTDNIPVARKGRFKDNRALGLARADVVVKYFQTTGELPAGVFTIESYGAQWSPYPNDSPVSRARNRTAVLRVSTTSSALPP